MSIERRRRDLGTHTYGNPERGAPDPAIEKWLRQNPEKNRIEKFTTEARRELGIASRVDGDAALRAREVDKYIVLPQGTQGGLEVYYHRGKRHEGKSIYRGIILPEDTEMHTTEFSAGPSGLGVARFEPDSPELRMLRTEERHALNHLHTRYTDENGREETITAGVMTVRDLEESGRKLARLTPLLAAEQAKLAQRIAAANAEKIERRGIDIDTISMVRFETLTSGPRSRFLDIRDGGSLRVRDGGNDQPVAATPAEQRQKVERWVEGVKASWDREDKRERERIIINNADSGSAKPMIDLGYAERPDVTNKTTPKEKN